MKLRKYSFIIATIASILLVIAGFVFFSPHRVVISLIGGFIFILATIFFFAGLPRLIIYFIYGIVTIVTLSLFDQYSLLIVFLLTIVIVVNPLAFFEHYLDNVLARKETKIYDFKIKGRYETFYKYRKEMKYYYHLPQMQKLMTLKWYNFLRNLIVIFFFTLIVFVIVYTTNTMLSVTSFYDVNILLIYFLIALTWMLIILYKRGFTSMFRVARISLFPSIYYLIYYLHQVTNLDDFVAIISYVIISLALIGMLIAEVYFYYSRVKYQAYEYLDPLTNTKVFANALYEPYIYDENKYSILFEFNSSLDFFHQKRFELLVYSNQNRTIITAYEAVERKIKLYVEFYLEKTIEKYNTKLSALFKTSIKKTILPDDYYEKKFLHNHDYIITRALSLANMANELEIQDELIIKISMYFDNFKNAKEVLLKYQTEITELSGKTVLTVLLKVKNVDYLIEANVRNLLLDMLVHQGTFIRVSVFY